MRSSSRRSARLAILLSASALLAAVRLRRRLAQRLVRHALLGLRREPPDRRRAGRHARRHRGLPALPADLGAAPERRAHGPRQSAAPRRPGAAREATSSPRRPTSTCSAPISPRTRRRPSQLDGERWSVGASPLRRSPPRRAGALGARSTSRGRAASLSGLAALSVGTAFVFYARDAHARPDAGAAPSRSSSGPSTSRSRAARSSTRTTTSSTSQRRRRSEDRRGARRASRTARRAGPRSSPCAASRPRRAAPRPRRADARPGRGGPSAPGGRSPRSIDAAVAAARALLEGDVARASAADGSTHDSDARRAHAERPGRGRSIRRRARLPTMLAAQPARRRRRRPRGSSRSPRAPRRARAASAARRSRSTARTRPGSRRPHRTGWCSRRSTSSTAGRRGPAPMLLRVDGRGQPARGRRCPSAPRSARGSRPPDTGEALGLGPACAHAHGRASGLRSSTTASASRGRRPAGPRRAPLVPGRRPRLPRGGGDLCVQACADDEQVAFHAVRNLARLGARHGRPALAADRLRRAPRRRRRPRRRRATSSASRTGPTTSLADDAGALDRFVWVGDETDQPWMRGGTYLVARRIRTRLEAWAATPLAAQEAGHRPVQGLGRAAHRPPGARPGRPRRAGSARRPRDPGRRPHPRGGAGDQRRRSASCGAGTASRTASTRGPRSSTRVCSSSASRRTPAQQFSRIQSSLAINDTLREYLVHTSSARLRLPAGREARSVTSAKHCFVTDERRARHGAPQGSQ